MRADPHPNGPVPAGVSLLALGGCGGESDDADGGPAASGKTAQAADGATFPQTVEHKFGSTTVPKKPERIAIVGLTEQDTVLALGYKPIATTEWYGEQPHAVWPWAREALGDAQADRARQRRRVRRSRSSPALRPDLIIGVNSGMKKATTRSCPSSRRRSPAGKGSTDYFSPWDEQVELIAKALGKPEEGRRAGRAGQGGLRQGGRANPEFKGKTVTFSQNAFYDGLLYVYPEGLNTEFLEYLGFTINPKLTPLVEEAGRAGRGLGGAAGRHRRRRDRVRDREAVGHRQLQEGADLQLPGGRQGQARRLHRRDPERRDVLHDAARDAVRTRERSRPSWPRPSPARRQRRWSAARRGPCATPTSTARPGRARRTRRS